MHHWEQREKLGLHKHVKVASLTVLVRNITQLAVYMLLSAKLMVSVQMSHTCTVKLAPLLGWFGLTKALFT